MPNEEFKPYKHDEILGDFYKHPTFGTIGFSRGQGGSRPLFGSSILHSERITLTVNHAELSRDLNRDAIFSRETIVEVEMSPTQFADAITSLNCGGNTPVTIRFIGGGKTENLFHVDPPYQNKVRQFNKEFEGHIDDLSKAFDTVITLAKETKAQVRLVKALEGLKMQFQGNTPFINEQFSKQMDNTVTEAKGQVEAFINRMVQSYGIEAIRNQSPKIPEANERTAGLIEGETHEEKPY